MPQGTAQGAIGSALYELNITALEGDIANALRSADSQQEPKLLLEREAQMLRDLRALKGRDDVTRKHLKAEVFALVKERLGIAPETKVKVEIDDEQSPDYLVVKPKQATQPPPPPDTESQLRWYWVDASPNEAAKTLATEFGIGVTDLYIPPTNGRVVVTGSEVYVSMTPEEAREYIV